MRNWVMRAHRQEGRRDEKGDAALGTAERDQLVRLRHENKPLRLEPSYLEAARFAR